MSKPIKILLLFFIPMGILYVQDHTDPLQTTHEKYHLVTIDHPGEKDPVEAILIEIQNENGLTVSYKMDVKSVICLEEVCKVIPVTLFWNELGVYQEYKLQKDATLEKYEADLFEPEDYLKLDHILKNSNSPFKEVYIDEILTVSTDVEGDIDAFSGETILELDDDETVHGAALTCYTLWHWANGEIISIIKTKTGESASVETLNHYIQNGNPVQFQLAIDELYRRNMFTNSLVNSVLQAVLKNPKLLLASIDYFEQCPNELYLYASEELYTRGEKEHKISILQSLNSTEKPVPILYLDRYSETVNQLDSYQEVSLLLDLMENKNPGSQTVINNVKPLLEADFFIARRAYWFLKNQQADIEDQDRFQQN